MNKIIFLRLATIAFFCFLSFSIQSENKICELSRNKLLKSCIKAGRVKAEIMQTRNVRPFESFMIKI